jgi:hypothetical protein
MSGRAEKIILPGLDDSATLQEIEAGAWIWGDYDADLDPVAPGSAIYGAIFRIDEHPSTDDALASFPVGQLNQFGQEGVEQTMQWAHKFTDNLDGTWDLQCMPNVDQVQWQLVQSGEGSQIIFADFATAYNIAGLPEWALINNPATSNWRNGLGDIHGAAEGDMIRFFDWTYAEETGYTYADALPLSPVQSRNEFQILEASAASGDEFVVPFINWFYWWISFDEDYLFDLTTHGAYSAFYEAKYITPAAPFFPAGYLDKYNFCDTLKIADPDGIIGDAITAGVLRNGSATGGPSPFHILAHSGTFTTVQDDPVFAYTVRATDNWQTIAASDVVRLDKVKGVWGVKKAPADAIKAAVGSSRFCLRADSSDGRYMHAVPVSAELINTTRQALEGMDTIKDNLLVQDSAPIQIGQYQDTGQPITRHIEILHEYLFQEPDDYRWIGVFGGTSGGDPTPQWLGGDFYHAPSGQTYPKVGESYDGYPFAGSPGLFTNGAESVGFPDEIPSRWWGSEQRLYGIGGQFLRVCPDNVEVVFAKLKVTGQVVTRIQRELLIAVDSFPFDYQSPGGETDPIKHVRLDRNFKNVATVITTDPTTLSLSFGLIVQNPNDGAAGDEWSFIDGSYSTSFTTNGVEQTVDLANTFNKFLELRGGPYKEIKVALVPEDTFTGYPDETGWEEVSFNPGTGVYTFENTVTTEQVSTPSVSISPVILKFALKDGADWRDSLPGCAPMGLQPSM